MKNDLTNLQELELLIEKSDQIFCNNLELYGIDPLIIPSCSYTEIRYIVELAEDADLEFLNKINLKLTVSYEFYKNFSKLNNITDFNAGTEN
jgi:hypothetical protein